MTAETTSTSGLIFCVAVPTPLFGVFDYLPHSEQDIAQQCIGARVQIPFGPRTLIGIIVQHKRESGTPLHKLKRILHVFDDDTALPADLLELVHWTARYYCHPEGECFSTALPVQLRQAKAAPSLELIRWQRTDLPYASPANASKQKSLLALLAQHADGLWQQSLTESGYTLAQLRTLERKGVIAQLRQTPQSAIKEPGTDYHHIRLNPAQQKIFDSLLQQPNGFSVALLQGITGSGKTEIYIQHVLHALKQGRQALILIPEINLTPQTVNRFQSALPCPVATLHSGMSTRSKYETWQMAKSGNVRVVIGTRSAIFTPFRELGLIIVDEEHDASYKQSDGLKYSGRDLAIKRAQIVQCPIVLGSATPSIETLYNAQTGKYLWLPLTDRAGPGSLPEVRLIDIRSRPLIDGCSDPMLKAIEQTLSAGNQVIVFQNRRGFAPTLMCYDCGWIAHCQYCDARMTLHASPPHLHCHHCDSRRAVPRQCGECKSSALNPIGTGTERIEAGLRARFAHTTIHRIDRDRFRRAEDMQGLIEAVATGEPCILIGTQMLAKGHDFHHVALVCVVDADASFFSADFRAIEKGTQLLIQIAGRTGRGAKAGRVLIQTRQPDHPLFASIVTHNYTQIALDVLTERKQCLLPPVSKLFSLRADSKHAESAEQVLSQIRQTLLDTPALHGHIQLSGPLPAQISRKQGMYRYFLHIFLTQPGVRSELTRLLQGMLSEHKDRRVRLGLDVDPTEYL